ncbi:potassium channel family protein [Oscillatoria salina]|nr:potassium channel family protein [Oscillatoria salina IIICB1]
MGENMSDRDNGFESQVTDLFDYEEFVGSVAQLLAERLTQNDLTRPEREFIGSRVYPRHGTLVAVRQGLSVTTVFFLIYCLVNTFTQVFSSSPNFILSVLAILAGLILIVLLVSEVFVGAGVEVEKEFKQEDDVVREYKFIPSLNRLPYLLLPIGLVFFTIIFGFSSLYAELFRQNPGNFWGLKDGFLSIYFSVVTFSTVGYGDVHPASLCSRTAAMCEIFIAMFFSLVALSTTLSWVTANERQQHEEFVKERIQEIQKRRASQGKDK